MELKTFISRSLTEISQGINAANDLLETDVFHIAGGEDEKVDFEIKLTLTSDDNISIKTEASAKLGFFGGKLGMSASDKSKSEDVHTIKFSVRSPNLSRFNFKKE